MFFKKNAGNGKTETPESAAAEPPKQKPAVAIPDVRAASTAARREPAAPAATRPEPLAASGQAPMSEETRKRAAAALQLSAAFAQVVTVLMRSPQHKHLALADLEWLVFPPLTTGQFAIANVQAKEGGASMPAALVLWASVSPDVDKKLSENLSGPMRLRPDEWKSGDILWLIEAVGDGRVVPGLLKQLSENALKGREVKMRVRGQDGKPAVRSLSDALRADEKAAAARAPQA